MKFNKNFWWGLITTVGAIPAAIFSQEASCIVLLPMGIWLLKIWWREVHEVDENEES